jgi:hypothetical protein
MKPLFYVAFFVLFCAAIALILRSVKRGRLPAYRYRPIQTINEAEFFNCLQRALPNYYIFPQVSMGAFLQPTAADPTTRNSDYYKICSKRVDYAVCDKTHKLIAIVELDDRSHDPAKDKIRDRIVESAGIRTVRFQSSKRPTEGEIVAAVLMPSVAQMTPRFAMAG